MQHSMTVLFPKGSSGLNAPMRLERPAARRMAVQKLLDFTRLCLKVSQGAQGVLSRHLLAPLVDEVGVVEWTGFHVSRFSRSLDLSVCERLSDQDSRGFFDLDWRWRNRAENDSSVCHGSAVSSDPRRNTEHGKVKSTATTQLLIRSAPSVCRR